MSRVYAVGSRGPNSIMIRSYVNNILFARVPVVLSDCSQRTQDLRQEEEWGRRRWKRT